MVDGLIGILEQHGISGLMLGIMSYICISQLNTIKSITKKNEDAMHIFAVKIEAKIDALSGDVADVDKSMAKQEGAREAESRRRRY